MWILQFHWSVQPLHKVRILTRIYRSERNALMLCSAGFYSQIAFWERETTSAFRTDDPGSCGDGGQWAWGGLLTAATEQRRSAAELDRERAERCCILCNGMRYLHTFVCLLSALSCTCNCNVMSLCKWLLTLNQILASTVIFSCSTVYYYAFHKGTSSKLARNSAMDCSLTHPPAVAGSWAEPRCTSWWGA